MQKSWRFYLFENDNQNFCFDCFTHKIYPISKEISDLISKSKFNQIKRKYNKFYKTVVEQKEFEAKCERENICRVTLNFSNKCNLNCAYCFRNKTNMKSMTNEEIDDVFDFVINKYQPDVEGYSVSLCLNSESSLEIEKLKYIDSLVAKYENRFFIESDFKLISADELFSKLPLKIQEKYSDSKSSLDKLNDILCNENLWEFYDYTKVDYVKSILDFSKELSFSKRVNVNRTIINSIFYQYNLWRDVKWIGLWLMTNGANVTDEFISFAKSICLNPISVSIDGPEEIHNYARRYGNGTGSFNDVIKGIKKLQENGFDVSASAVITPKYPDAEKIVDYLLSLNVKSISLGLSRGKNEICQFNKESIDILLKSIERIYKRILDELKSCSTNTPLFDVLKNSLLVLGIKQLYFRLYRSNRCTWGKSLIIDSKGDVYHCDSTVGYKEDFQGNYKTGITKDFYYIPSVNDNKKCKKCWAKYFCGGTCHAEKVLKNQNNIDMECYFKKELTKLGFNFYLELYKNNLLKEFCEQ